MAGEHHLQSWLFCILKIKGCKVQPLLGSSIHGTLQDSSGAATSRSKALKSVKGYVHVPTQHMLNKVRIGLSQILRLGPFKFAGL